MADPVSLLASAIAIAGLAEGVLKSAKNLYNASKEIRTLRNELADVQALARQIEAVFKEPWPPDQKANVERAEKLLTDTIQPSLQNLDELINKHLSEKAVHKFRRGAWVILKSNITGEREVIQHAKEELFRTFQLINDSNTRGIAFSIEQLTTDVATARTTDVRSHNESLTRLGEMQAGVRDSHGESVRHFEEVKDLFQVIGTNVTENLDIGRQNQNDIQALLQIMSRLYPGYASQAGQAASATLPTPIANSVTCTLAGTQTTCSPSCRCRCHQKHVHISSPRFVDRVLGKLFVSFSVGAWTTPGCDTEECRRTKRTVARLRYTFPAWMFQYSILMTTYLSKHAEPPEFLIRTSRRRSHLDPIWDHVALGNVGAVHALFKAGQASIYDIEDQCAHTLLHRAISAKRVNMIKYLVEQGADVDVIDDKTTSCGDKFMAMVLSRGLPEDHYGPLLQYFKSSTYVEDGQLTLLHKVIFGYSLIPLEQILQDSPELINKPDAYGRTPLEWASARGDVAVVRALLNHKADPSIIDKGGWGALHNAVLTDSPEVTQLLLEHGVNPNHPSEVFFETPLHIAVRFERLRHHIPILLKHKADASLSTKTGDLPLVFAAGRDYPSIVELLVKVTPADKHQKAYVAAIKNSAVRAFGELLRQNAHLGGADHAGKTVWHYTALYGKIEILRLLRTAKMFPSVALNDHAGLTARTIATGRDEDEEWVETWNALEKEESEGITTVS